MKIAIVGAGSIGGFLGARLAGAGEEVTFIARGANLQAIRADGFKLIEEDGAERSVRGIHATSNTVEAGAQDLVLLAVKAHQVGAVAAELPALLASDTAVVTLQNGIPWWYFYKHGGEFDGRAVRSADPDGAIAAHIPNERVIGAVVYPAAELLAPGVVKVIEGDRYTLGEPDGSTSPRIQRIAEVLRRAGFKAPISADVRTEIWLKLWGNLTFNPVSALTHATLAGICRYPLTHRLAASMMAEAQAIAGKLGIRLRMPIDQRIAGAARVGEHKTSMLQDIEHGRAIELEAVVGAVLELGRLTQVPAPHIEAVYACCSLLAATLAQRKGRLRIDAAD